MPEPYGRQVSQSQAFYCAAVLASCAASLRSRSRIDRNEALVFQLK